MHKIANAFAIMVIAFALAGFASCSNPASSSGGTSATTSTTNPTTRTIDTHADTSTADTAYSNGFAAAAQSTSTSSPAYITVSPTGGVTYTFNNYSSDGITMNGSLSIATSGTTDTINGTITYSGTGTSVSKIVYNNITFTGTTYSGTLEYYFTDGTKWSYNYRTAVFSQS